MTEPNLNTPNPYAAPSTPSDASRGLTPGQILVLLLLGMLILPAAVVALSERVS